MNLRRLFRLYRIYAKMDMAWFLRDTKYALLGILADGIANASSVASIFLLAIRFGGIGDMNYYEVLFMLGYVSLITGVYQTFFANCNTGHISRRIGRGQVEHMLIQPMAMPYQLITEGFIPFTGSSNLFTGGAILAYAVYKLQIPLTWWWCPLFMANVLITMVIMIAQSYLFSSLAFYAPVAAEEISSTIIDLGGNLSEYPLSGMSKSVQIPLITILPVGLMAWFPSLALLGKPPMNLPYFFPAYIAFPLFILAQYTFRKGLRHYVKKGSNRYLPYGHRR